MSVLPRISDSGRTLRDFRLGSEADLTRSNRDVSFTPIHRGSRNVLPVSRVALHKKPHRLLFRPDDHCPVNSVVILCMRNADPLRAVQQQISAMSSRISPLL